MRAAYRRRQSSETRRKVFLASPCLFTRTRLPNPNAIAREGFRFWPWLRSLFLKPVAPREN